MVKFKEGKIDDDYIQSLGVNFMEKTVNLQNALITFSLWDVGKSNEFLSILPLVCNDSVAIFFMFDLSRKSTLLSIKEWYRQARCLNMVTLSISFEKKLLPVLFITQLFGLISH